MGEKGEQKLGVYKSGCLQEYLDLNSRVEKIPYFSPSVISTKKSRRMGWVEHIIHVRKMKHRHRILVGIPEWKSPLK